MEMIANQSRLGQMSLFNSFAGMQERTLNWLMQTWAFPFRLFIYPLIDPSLFDCLYSTIDSRPANPPQVIVSLLVIQAMFNKTDDEMHDWMMSGGVDLRFATNTLGVDAKNLPTNDKQLSRFRVRVRDYAAAHDGYSPLEECMKSISFGMAALMGLNLDNVRIDSTMVAANMARMSRQELLYTVNRNMVQLLSKNHGEETFKATLSSNKLSHYLDACDHNAFLYYSKVSSDDKCALLVTESQRILDLCSPTELESASGEIFVRVLNEQTVVDENGKRRLATSEDGTMTSRCVQNPADPSSTFRKKAGKEFIGYIINLVESVGAQGSLVLSWDFEQNVVADPVMAMAFMKSADSILSGIREWQTKLNMDEDADMQKCQDLLQTKMKMVADEIRAIRDQGRTIPRSIDMGVLADSSDAANNNDADTHRQVTLDDLLATLVPDVKTTETGNAEGGKAEAAGSGSDADAGSEKTSHDSTPIEASATGDDQSDEAGAHTPSQGTTEPVSDEAAAQPETTPEQKDQENGNAEGGKAEAAGLGSGSEKASHDSTPIEASATPDGQADEAGDHTPSQGTAEPVSDEAAVQPETTPEQKAQETGNAEEAAEAGSGSEADADAGSEKASHDSTPNEASATGNDQSDEAGTHTPSQGTAEPVSDDAAAQPEAVLEQKDQEKSSSFQGSRMQTVNSTGPDGKTTTTWTVLGKPGMEGIKLSEFANLPDDQRREALLHAVLVKHPLDLDPGDLNLIVADGAYATDELRKAALDAGFLLMPTDLTGKRVNPIVGLYTFDDDKTKVITCPMGYEPLPESQNLYNSGCLRFKMEADHCCNCPFRNDCKSKQQQRTDTAVVQISPNAQGRIFTEAAMGTEEYKLFGRFRNGVETIPGFLHNHLHIDSLPIGQELKKIYMDVKVGALNACKMIRFVMGKTKYAPNPLYTR